jgi:hypothetical protein
MENAILVHFTPKGPDLAPSDFHMFGPIKEPLRGKIFLSDEEVTGAVRNWLQMHPPQKKNSSSYGIKNT